MEINDEKRIFFRCLSGKQTGLSVLIRSYIQAIRGGVLTGLL